jgi:histidinol-phosphate aminotransferase
LREALAAHHGVAPEQVFCGNGSNEVLQCLLSAYGGPRRKALVFEPTYALHSHIARLTGTTVVDAERDAAHAVDLAEAARVIEQEHPDLVFLCSPNNPTGNADPLGTVAALLERSPGLLVVDEAYGQFAPSSAIELLSQSPDLVVVRTFSKTWSMAALRLGYFLAHPEVVEACERVALPYHLDALKQAAGLIALRYEAEMNDRVRRLVEQRGRVEAALGALEVEVWPSDANFICFRPRTHSAAEVWTGLLERSVLVRNISGFPRLAGCLRVTIGTVEENDRFLEALREVLDAPTAA